MGNAIVTTKAVQKGKATSYSVVTEFGTVTRTSRSFNFGYVVVVCGVRESVIEHKREENRKIDTEQIVEYQAVIEGRKAVGSRYLKVEDYVGFLANARESLATVDSRHDEWKAKNAQAIAEKRGGDLTWSTKRDRAINEARKACDYHHFVAAYDLATGEEIFRQEQN